MHRQFIQRVINNFGVNGAALDKPLMSVKGGTKKDLRRERGSEMQKVIVLCNVPHIIEPGVCALCERDEAKAKLEAAEEMARALKALLRDHGEMEKLEGCVCLKFETEQEARACLSAWDKAGKGEG